MPKVIIILFVVAMSGMVGFIIYKSITPKTASTIPASDSVETSVQSLTTKDFAPNLPMSQKTTIVIRLPDSSTSKYIVPTNQVSTYVMHLPKGYTVVSTSK